MIIIDFKLKCVTEHRVNICTLNIRRLLEDKPSVVARYDKKAKKLIVSNKINRKLNNLEAKWDNFNKIQRSEKLDMIDK